jgi:hypothetical protein
VFETELARLGWGDKGGRVVVEEIDKIEESEIASIAQGFVVFPDSDADAEPGETHMQTPFLLIAASGFSVYSDALPEPWLLTRRAMNSFRNAICYDASGTAHTITDVVPLRQMTLYDRMLPWRQIPVRLVLQPGPVLSLADIRARLVSALKGENEIADFLKIPVNEASARLKKAGSALELIETAKSIV